MIDLNLLLLFIKMKFTFFISGIQELSDGERSKNMTSDLFIEWLNPIYY